MAAAPRGAGGDGGAAPSRYLRRRGPFSPLTLRIMAINALAPALLVAALLYLDQYRAGLIEARIASLITQGELIAGALGESTLLAQGEALELQPEIARRIVRRLVAPTETRARLFDEDGELLADSRALAAAGRHVVTRVLPPPDPGLALRGIMERFYDAFDALLPGPRDVPPYVERPNQRADDYDEVLAAMAGDIAAAVRAVPGGPQIISVAVPVQGLRKVLGALMLTVDSREIEERVRTERLNILLLLVAVLALTVLLSLFLAGTMARPIRRLAVAADRVRRGRNRRLAIPDFSHRQDEIGDLSEALRDMTAALYQRMDAIEAFAADVAHELKNPLTSLSSAIEMIGRIDDPEKRRRLHQIVEDDVRRLDRLISDISAASRLDAELSRAELEPVDLAALLGNLAEVYEATAGPGAPRLAVEIDRRSQGLRVAGLEDRLGQVVRNLLDNAVSFSPPDGLVRLSIARDGARVRLRVEDEGPGFPEGTEESVFERFYSERPPGERFGTHSGLGLSISRQIVEAHGGTIRAANRLDGDGRVIGACMTVELPALAASHRH